MKIKSSNRWKKLQLKEVVDYEQPNPYIVTTKIKDDGDLPVLTPGKSFIKGYTDEKEGIYENTPVIIFDDFTTDNKLVNFPFKVKSSAMKLLKTNTEKADLRFIFYQMQLIDVNTTTHKRYYISHYQNLEFLFPTDKNGEISLELQKQIVDEIEKQFTRLEASVKDLKSVKDKLEVYRKSVLKSAFDKKKNWMESSIGDAFITNPKKQEVSNIEDTKKISFIPMKSVSENLKKIMEREDRNLGTVRKGYTYFKEGDLILAKITPCFENGKIAIADDLTNNLGFGSTEFHVFRANNDKLIIKYLYYYLQQSDFIGDAKRNMTGTAGQLRVPIKFIQNYSIVYPKSIESQQKIVQEIESHFSVIDKLQEVIESSLNKTEKLRKSILKSAFEEELVKAK